MSKSSKKSDVKVDVAVPVPDVKSSKTGAKREAEEALEKLASAKKQKEIVEAKKAPLPKMAESSSFEADCSSESESEEKLREDIMAMQCTRNEMMELIMKMLEVQRTHNEWVIAALERVVGSSNQPRPGSVLDFRQLHPAMFTGEESPLDAEQWLVVTEALLTAARIPDADRVDIVKIQLTGMARSWWLMEERYMEKPISWGTFSGSFLTMFFPDTVKNDMEHKFIKLVQGNMSVDEYAAEFTRLSRFAPYLVSTEKNRARRFQQGLVLELRLYIVTFQFNTFAEVLAAAREQEKLSERIGTPKRPTRQI